MFEYRFFVWGEIDLANAGDLQADLALAVDATRADVIIDCRDLTFIDSSGVQVLMRTRRILQEQGRDLRITHAGTEVRRVIEEVFGLLERTRVDA